VLISIPINFIQQNYIKRVMERAGGEWKTTATHRRNWKLLIEKVVREKWGKRRGRKRRRKRNRNLGQPNLWRGIQHDLWNYV